ncbi:hypothetical protein LOTGIDRAFT_239579 [Lottia gigantea]|uniref:Uncharacterized protein n=1 Tax=Lottia gigantea TaxID=225164 RepID=V4BT45_LOTGI|nr:hypothetical protein LOTGIDRAFT_239579 [Lottia gigantea]ESO92289.1 hypothetical protein LOTGIDRAFT_239579 [Lottia gigantea]
MFHYIGWFSFNGIEFERLKHLKSNTSANVQTQNIRDLIQRVIGSRANEFNLTVDLALGPAERDTYKIVTQNGKGQINGTSGVGVAMGFYYYIKYYCGGQFTWAGQQINLPTPLPVVPSPGITKTSNDRMTNYTIQKYGHHDTEVDQAGNILLKSFHGKNGFVKYPRLSPKFYIWYSPNFLYQAWDLMVKASPNLITVIYLDKLEIYYITITIRKVVSIRQTINLDYMNTMLGTTTQWRDSKQWTGLFADFYLPRWQLFIDTLKGNHLMVRLM